MNALYLKTLFAFFTSIYSLNFSTIDGATVNVGSFKNKQILIVNTAGNSKYANQYAGLELLYQKYIDSLIIIAFPSNDFNNEANKDLTIKTALFTKYKIHYILGSKSSVSGINISPIFKWLTSSSLNGNIENPVPGDFTKFLIDGKGNIKGIFSGVVDPMDSVIQNAISN